MIELLIKLATSLSMSTNTRRLIP